MSQPHTFTTNYDLLKIGLGSNAFDNPYHFLYNSTMDIIDAQLWSDEQFRDALDGTGSGFIRHTGGGAFAAEEPLRPHQQAGWHTDSSVQVTSDVGQSPFSDGTTTVTLPGTLSLLKITLFPVITGKPLPLSLFGLYVTTASVSQGFGIIAYSSNAAGHPDALLDAGDIIKGPPPTYFLPVGLHVGGGMSILESLPPGMLVWLGVVQGFGGGDLPCKAIASPRGYLGYDSDGVAVTGLMQSFDDPEPPAVWTDADASAWTGPVPLFFRTV